MAVASRFDELIVWRKARLMAQSIYELDKDIGAKDYGLRDQMRRAAVSTMSNIAEGYGQRASRDFARFVDIATGSMNEVQSLLYVALDQGYIDRFRFDQIMNQCRAITAMLRKLAIYLRTTSNSTSSTTSKKS